MPKKIQASNDGLHYAICSKTDDVYARFLYPADRDAALEQMQDCFPDFGFRGGGR
jgi:hypothetical protein